ncbi:protein of unknown function DUF820 [Spirosoma linguale DSM 74]|uniref:Putative restriction endonuclease domain-containing protein n=2 Tax=Spirosoma TaxID=107 RepID=D2QD90_SPILD|nr:protein of unknown function DUF820 [Spirosoma linguale DSM 74]
MEAVAVAEQAVEEVVRSQYELERGKPVPSKNHSRLQQRIGVELAIHYGDQYDTYSELSLEAPNPSMVPDLCLFPVEPSNWREDEVRVSAVPLTVIEIVSPSQTDTELTEKSKAYFAAGVKSYWLVQPVLRTVFVLLPNGDELVFHNDMLTDPTNGVSIDLKKVFR